LIAMTILIVSASSRFIVAGVALGVPLSMGSTCTDSGCAEGCADLCAVNMGAGVGRCDRV